MVLHSGEKNGQKYGCPSDHLPPQQRIVGRRGDVLMEFHNIRFDGNLSDKTKISQRISEVSTKIHIFQTIEKWILTNVS